MSAKKITALLLSAIMVCSLAACGETTPAAQTAETVTEETGETAVTVTPSIDFEDGLYGFIGMDMAAGNADESVLTIEDFNGSKALKVTTQGNVPYVLIAVDVLLGDKVADLRTIQMDIATENPDGTFYASSGNIYVYSEADNSVNTFGGWSVYLETANPKTASYTIPETQVLQAGNYIAVSLETDNGKDAGVAAANFIIDNIAFLDADGNTITADTAATYVAPVTEDIWAGLTPIANETEIEGFAVAGEGWAQNGVNTTLNDGTFDATTLKPGSILTIYYSSESEIDKDMWLVGVSTEDNPKGTWLRICDKDGALTATYNEDHTMAQITYEQIAEVLGEDFASTLTVLQCESDAKWEVYKVTVGTKATPLYAVTGETDIEGFAVKADGWAQNGINTTLNGGTFDATTIVPGSVLTIKYASESTIAEDMWLVGVSSEDNPKGTWLRICGDQEAQTAVYNADHSVCQITYEQIVAVLGEDFASTLMTLQCESDAAWEVYSVSVGMAAPSYMEAVDQVEIEDFAVKADGWAQNGVNTTLNGGTFDAATIVPGSVITISYKSESTLAEDMWLVGVSTEDNPKGTWLRICGDQEAGTATYNDDHTKCQITYDQIVAVLGEDFASTLTVLQCESDAAWEVYSVTIGTAAN